MASLKAKITVETPFGKYVLKKLLGQGGAGKVYSAVRDDKAPVAVKILTQISKDKLRRFQNEIAFLSQTRHPNIVAVSDYGLAELDGQKMSFYVMEQYDGSLRQRMDAGISPDQAMSYFCQMMDGVEAAHLKGVTHRDLKPENFLYRASSDSVAVADFGIASFSAEFLMSGGKTPTGQRLANFVYAAPEQRRPGATVGLTADLYALGFILNELYTTRVPHGSRYVQISTAAKDYGFLDAIVDELIRQDPGDRPQSIAHLKAEIERHQGYAISRQKIHQIDRTVVTATEIDNPLALAPPVLVGARWEDGWLILTLDRPVTSEWVKALNGSSVQGFEGSSPRDFKFDSDKATVAAGEREAQAIINNFKNWLPVATRTLKRQLETAAQKEAELRHRRLQYERETEIIQQRINQSLKI